MTQHPLGTEADLAKRIAKEREARDWSLAALSARTGIERTNLFRIERGERPIRVSQLVALSRVFAVSTDDLLTPTELVEQREADQLLRQFADALEDWETASTRLGKSRAAVRDYVNSHPGSPTSEYLLRQLDHYLDQGESPSLSLNESTKE